MNKIILIIALLITSKVLAQSPEKMSYQAIVRNTDGGLVSNKSIGVQISILQGTVSGTAAYVETHAPTSNINGLITLEIGNGSKSTGSFSEIDWGAQTYFIKIETDLTGGSNYTISGTSQLLSVPFALYAKKAGNVKTYKIGDFAHGGIVFWVDETKQHGLVCAKQDQISATKWFAGKFGSTYARGNGLFAGKSNNTLIISTQVFFGDDDSDYAARICNQLEVIENSVLYGDWYLPSVFELKLLSQSLAIINNTSTNNEGSALLNSFYWSSTEASSNNAKIVNVSNAQESSVFKSSQNPVRAIRSF
tara:strand:- start:3445 stop:4362 length:918 start_codon:yes stop_codon:yes gene_type:complete